MAGALAAACVSPLISLPSTHLLSSSPVGYTLFPSKSPSYHRYYYYGARIDGNPRPTIRHGKLNNNASRGEEVQEEIEDDEIFFQFMEEEIDGDDDGDEDDAESSLDLLFRFLYSMFKKLSKRATKASRAVLPDVISPQLVSFSVDGVLLLASLSILKALLEVVCTLGGTVFVVILMLRVIWAAVSYFQSSANNFNRSGPSFNRTRPVT